MADPSPLDGLLDRAGNALTLAESLAAALTEQSRKRRGKVGAADKSRFVSDLDGLGAALTDLGGAIVSPPEGFASVAASLRDIDGIANEIRTKMGRPQGLTWGEVLEFLSRLSEACNNGRRARCSGDTARRQNQPLAGHAAAGSDNPHGIDTTPQSPRPPSHLVDAAERSIPEILANVRPSDAGLIEMTAASLVKKLQDVGHTRAASQWAVNHAVLAERLRPTPVTFDAPTFGRRRGTKHLFGKQGKADIDWRDGKTQAADISKGKPTPFESFKVIATELLSEWWRLQHIESKVQAARADGADINESSDSADISPPDTPSGFLGGEALADALGIHPTRRIAFSEQLRRKRIRLGDDCYREVLDPPPNSPRFIYRVDSPRLRELAAAYVRPKPA